MAISSARSPRAPHLRLPLIALVTIGGSVGTAGRAALTLLLPQPGPFPLMVLGINVVGAFLLGCLLTVLARRGSDDGRRRELRLALGTGVLGGFTTYSALAVDSALLLRDGDVWTAAAYGLATVVIGAAATWLGIVLGAGTRTR